MAFRKQDTPAPPKDKKAPADKPVTPKDVAAPPDGPVSRVTLAADGFDPVVVKPGDKIPAFRASKITVESTADVFAANVDWFNIDLISSLKPYGLVEVTPQSPVWYNPTEHAFYLP